MPERGFCWLRCHRIAPIVGNAEMRCARTLLDPGRDSVNRDRPRVSAGCIEIGKLSQPLQIPLGRKDKTHFTAFRPGDQVPGTGPEQSYILGCVDARRVTFIGKPRQVKACVVHTGMRQVRPPASERYKLIKGEFEPEILKHCSEVLAGVQPFSHLHREFCIDIPGKTQGKATFLKRLAYRRHTRGGFGKIQFSAEHPGWDFICRIHCATREHKSPCRKGHGAGALHHQQFGLSTGRLAEDHQRGSRTGGRQLFFRRHLTPFRAKSSAGNPFPQHKQASHPIYRCPASGQCLILLGRGIPVMPVLEIWLILTFQLWALGAAIMQRFILWAAALGMAGLWTPAASARNGAVNLPVTGSGSVSVMRHGNRGPHLHMHRFGHMTGGHRHGGFFAPGWMVWRAPVFGYVLPSYWVQPAFYIADYRAYGLPVPPYGYGWSRYYDDAVLTDRYGRVYDSRRGIRWEDTYRQAPPPRLPDYDYGDYNDYGVTYGHASAEPEYRGTWTGTWTGADGRTYSGTYSGEYRSGGDAVPHWQSAPAMQPAPVLPYQTGYYAGGYYYPAPSVTTVVVHPSVTTTTTTFIEEEVIHPAPRKTWSPKRKSVKRR